MLHQLSLSMYSLVLEGSRVSFTPKKGKYVDLNLDDLIEYEVVSALLLDHFVEAVLVLLLWEHSSLKAS